MRRARRAPLRRPPTHVDTWVKHLGRSPQVATGRPAAPATIARRLSCLSKFYDYGMREIELIEHSPVANVRRPKVSEDSPTIGLDAAELDRLLTAAEADGARSTAVVHLLVYNGLRIDEALACDVEDLTYQRRHRVLRIVRKGGVASTEPLSPIVVRVLEDCAAGRTTGPVFLNRDGTGRLSYSTSYALIRRLARRARIPVANQLSPHSLRHSFATELLAAGVPLQDVQDAMGHADPRTTRRYDRPGTTSTGTRRTRWRASCGGRQPPPRRLGQISGRNAAPNRADQWWAEDQFERQVASDLGRGMTVSRATPPWLPGM